MPYSVMMTTVPAIAVSPRSNVHLAAPTPPNRAQRHLFCSNVRRSWRGWQFVSKSRPFREVARGRGYGLEMTSVSVALALTPSYSRVANNSPTARTIPISRSFSRDADQSSSIMLPRHAGDRCISLGWLQPHDDGPRQLDLTISRERRIAARLTSMGVCECEEIIIAMASGWICSAKAIAASRFMGVRL
jgi:hypothetical protein